MIQLWLDAHPLIVFAALALVYCGLGLFFWYMTYKSRFGSRIRHLHGLVPAFFSSTAVLFALLTGFLAVDAGDRNKQAHNKVQAEAASLRALHTLSIAATGDMRAIRVALRTYVESVVTREWNSMARGGPAAETDAAYDALLREVSNPTYSAIASSPVHNALLAAAMDTGTSRNARLALASDRTNDVKWLSVLILGVITQLAIGLVHLGHSRRVFLLGQLVFASAVIVALGIIGLQEKPFDGVFRVEPTPIAAVLKLPVENPNVQRDVRP